MKTCRTRSTRSISMMMGRPCIQVECIMSSCNPNVMKQELMKMIFSGNWGPRGSSVVIGEETISPTSTPNFCESISGWKRLIVVLNSRCESIKYCTWFNISDSCNH